VIEVIDTINFI